MALITCPDCGQSISDAAATCIHCGRPQRCLLTATTFPLFPVASHKFVVLSICTFSIYELYWCYQNWKRLMSASGERLSPFWRTVFAPFWVFSLCRRIRDRAALQGVTANWSPGVLGTFYLVFFVLGGLPDPWNWISLACWVPMIPVQQAAQQLNELHAKSVVEARNDNYSTANVAIMIIGGLSLVLAIVSIFMQTVPPPPLQQWSIPSTLPHPLQTLHQA